MPEKPLYEDLEREIHELKKDLERAREGDPVRRATDEQVHLVRYMEELQAMSPQDRLGILRTLCSWFDVPLAPWGPGGR